MRRSQWQLKAVDEDFPLGGFRRNGRNGSAPGLSGNLKGSAGRARILEAAVDYVRPRYESVQKVASYQPDEQREFDATGPLLFLT